MKVDDHLNGTYYGLALTAGFGYDAVYPELQIDTLLNAAGKREADRYVREDVDGGVHHVGEEVRDRWWARGATVQFNGAVLGEHLVGAITGAGSAVTYLADRLAGERAVSTC